MSLLSRLRELLSRRQQREPLTREQAVSAKAAERVESFADRMERAAAMRALGQRVVWYTSQGVVMYDDDVLVWVGRKGESASVSSGTWLLGFAGLYTLAPAERLPQHGSSQNGYLVYSPSLDTWHSPSRVLVASI